MWVGLQNFKEEKMYDDSDLDANPFQTALISKKIYANGKEFIEKVSYNVNLRRWDRACMYLEAKSFGKFKTTHTYECDEPKHFVCKWNGKKNFNALKASLFLFTLFRPPLVSPVV